MATRAGEYSGSQVAGTAAQTRMLHPEAGSLSLLTALGTTAVRWIQRRLNMILGGK